jgi:hypothetical protein
MWPFRRLLDLLQVNVWDTRAYRVRITIPPSLLARADELIE